MNLVAKKLSNSADNRTGAVWLKKWSLMDGDTSQVFGEMVWNSGWSTQKFNVSIHNPIHAELGLQGYATFSDRTEALKWAREQIQNLPTPTRALVEAAIQSVRDSRYRDEMSDDFAYSNGKVAYWDRLERELQNMLKTFA
jgi:hypothetical protein